MVARWDVYLLRALRQQDSTSGQLDPVYDLLRIRYPDGQPEKIATNAFLPRISSDSSRLVYITISRILEGMTCSWQMPMEAIPGKSLSASPGLRNHRCSIFSPDGQFILVGVPSPKRSLSAKSVGALYGNSGGKSSRCPSDWWSVPITGGAPTQLAQHPDDQPVCEHLARQTTFCQSEWRRSFRHGFGRLEPHAVGF